MKLQNLSALLGTVAVATCVSMATAPAARAFTIGPNWTYTMDSFRDGNDGNVGVGLKSNYEMYGLAVRAYDGIVSIAFNANLALTGQADSAADGNIGWGDLFFNFTGKSFKDASAAGELLGIRFADTNDSGASEVGVYDNVKAKSVIKENSGFKSFNHYQDHVNNHAKDTTPGGNKGEIGYGGLTPEEAKAYLTAETKMKTVTKTIEVPVTKTVTKKVKELVRETVLKPVKVKENGKWVTKQVPTEVQKWVTKTVTENVIVMEKKKVTEQVPETKINDSDYSIQNVIASGTKVGNISFLGGNDLSVLTEGFKALGGVGKYTMGFSFDQKLLRPGNAILTLLEECTNDGMALKVQVPGLTPPGEEVPEPMTIAGLAMGGAGLAGLKRRRQRLAN